jgi:hypothetical protein
MRTEEELIKVTVFFDTDNEFVTDSFIKGQPDGVYIQIKTNRNYAIWIKEGNMAFPTPDFSFRIRKEGANSEIVRDASEDKENYPETKQIRNGGWVNSKTLLEIIKVLSENKNK